MLRGRMRIALKIASILLAAGAVTAATGACDSDSKLSYDKPAAKWTEALPVGKGRIGAMVFGGGTGCSTVWRVALWARLQNSEHAYDNLKILINTSTLPNMFDLCSPFQIDGNLGGPAAITEMLVQSTADETTVLPALPRQWSSGSLKGVRVRGGGKVDIAWNDGRLTEIRLGSDIARKYRVSYGQYSAEARIERGGALCSMAASAESINNSCRTQAEIKKFQER